MGRPSMSEEEKALKAKQREEDKKRKEEEALKAKEGNALESSSILSEDRVILCKKIVDEVREKYTDEVTLDDLTEVEKCIIFQDTELNVLRRREKQNKELNDSSYINVLFDTTTAKKRFVKMCEEKGIAPERALNLLAKGFTEEKFILQSRTEWFV